MARLQLDATAWDSPAFSAAFYAAQDRHIRRSLAAERRAWAQQDREDMRAARADIAEDGPTFGADLADLTAESDGAE